MTPRTDGNRLFVPLKASPFAAFAGGSKTWEMRRRRHQWTRTNVFIGRRVELRRGYRVGNSLWGQIVAVEEASSVARMFAHVGYAPFIPRAASKVEALRIAAETLGSADDPVIAFQIILDAERPKCGI